MVYNFKGLHGEKCSVVVWHVPKRDLSMIAAARHSLIFDLTRGELFSGWSTAISVGILVTTAYSDEADWTDVYKSRANW